MPFRENIQPGYIEALATDPALGAYNVFPGSLWLDLSLTPPILKERNAANTAWVTTGASGGGTNLGTWVDTFTATANQTSFLLTHTPASITDIHPIQNSIPQDNANITALSVKTITVVTGLNAGDTVAFRYTRLD